MEQNLEPIRKTSGTGIYQVLRYALSFGAGVRQLSRLTGVSFGVVQKLKNDHFRTDPVIPSSKQLPFVKKTRSTPFSSKKELTLQQISK